MFVLLSSMLLLVAVEPLIWCQIIDLIFFSSLKLEMSVYSVIFLVSLSVITATVGWFGEIYVGADSHKPVFWLTFLGFVAGMSILIFAGDFLLLIFGWEVLGITSYLLVAGYLSSLASNGALKTVLFNRIGDVFFVLVFSLLFLKLSWVFFMGVVLFAICKSAQFPFSAWLPAAMAAPTPVSALVHSSTLVTAGLWVLLKLEVGGLVLLLLGSSTMLVGAFCALIESDLKKVVAFSTLSQLGLLMMAISVFSFQNGFFHLITHAFFKSMLFISVGYSIMASSHNQQGLHMGANSLGVLVMSWTSLLSMSGCLFFSGFFSKHSVLSEVQVSVLPVILLVVMAVGSIFTCLYSVRLASSLLKLSKVSVLSPIQIGLLGCSLIGGGLISKFLTFETYFNLSSSGLLSFLFLVWGFWSWVILSESEVVASIFFSSFVSGGGVGLSLATGLLDESIFAVRSVALTTVSTDGGKLASLGVLLLVTLVLFI